MTDALETVQLAHDALMGWVDGVLIVDGTGRVALLNVRARELFGWDARAWDGASVADFYRAVALQTTVGEALALRFENHAQRAAAQPRFEFELRAPRATNLEALWFAVTQAGDNARAYGVVWRAAPHALSSEVMKSQLLATVSHELRTPLASIKGFATTLLRQDVQWDAATQREFLRIIEEESNRLEELIDHLLDMAQVEAGALRIHPEPLQLRRSVREAVAQVQHRAAGHWFVVDLPSELPRVWADPRRIRQVLSNLLENAIKYSPEGGEISVRCEVAAGQVIVSVADHGVGISPEWQARVFDRFFQVDGASTRQVGGSGLGLAIAQGIVQAHHGTIWVESVVGQGSVFRFTLPIVKEADLRHNSDTLE